MGNRGNLRTVREFVDRFKPIVRHWFAVLMTLLSGGLLLIFQDQLRDYSNEIVFGLLAFFWLFIGAVLVWTVTWFFSRQTARTIGYSHGTDGPLSFRYRFWIRVAVVCIATTVWLSPLGLFISNERHKSSQRERQFIVVLSEFAGPEKENYQITREIVDSVQECLARYDDATLAYVDESPTDMESARTILTREQADVLIWGWYGLSDRSAILSLHVELPNRTSIESFSVAGSYRCTVDVAEISSFRLQQRIGSEMQAMIHSLYGVIAYERAQYSEALSSFTRALESGTWPEGLVGQEDVLLLKGKCHLFRFENEEAVASLNRALMMSRSTRFDIFNTRGVAYMRLRQFPEALEDFTRALEIDSNSAETYKMRGMTHLLMDSFADAISDLGTASRFDASDPVVHANLGIACALAGENELGEQALRRAVALDPSDAQSYALLGVICCNAGRCEEALAFWDKAIQLAAHRADYLGARAVIKSALEDREGAIRDLEKALEIEPESALTWENLAGNLEQIGLKAEAIDHYTRAIGLQPDLDSAFYRRGLLYGSIGDYDRAASDLTAAIDINPDEPSYFGQRGYSYLRLGEYEKAIMDFDRALEVGSGSARYHEHRGYCFGQLGNHNAAIDDFNTSLSLDQESSNVYYYRALSRLVLGQIREAISDCNRALARDPGDCVVLLTRAKALTQLREYERSLADVAAVRRICPECREALLVAGYAFYCLGALEEALPLYETAIQRGETGPLALQQRAELLAKMGRYGKAIEAYNEYLEIHPPTSEILNGRGISYMNKGDLDAALSDFISARLEDPGQPEIANNIGIVYGLKGQYEEALDVLDAVISAFPDSARAYANRGNVHAWLGDFQAAVKDYSILIEKDGENAGAYYNRAMAYVNIGECEKGCEDLRRVLSLNPGITLRQAAMELLLKTLANCP